MLLLIDNYDSFTYNSCIIWASLGLKPVFWCNDALTVTEALAMGPMASCCPGHVTPGCAGGHLP